MFTPATEKAYLKGYAAGRADRSSRDRRGVEAPRYVPYCRATYVTAWGRGFKDGFEGVALS